jgi:hypothetical protein
VKRTDCIEVERDNGLLRRFFAFVLSIGLTVGPTVAETLKRASHLCVSYIDVELDNDESNDGVFSILKPLIGHDFSRTEIEKYLGIVNTWLTASGHKVKPGMCIAVLPELLSGTEDIELTVVIRRAPNSAKIAGSTTANFAMAKRSPPSPFWNASPVLGNFAEPASRLQTFHPEKQKSLFADIAHSDSIFTTPSSKRWSMNPSSGRAIDTSLWSTEQTDLEGFLLGRRSTYYGYDAETNF